MISVIRTKTFIKYARIQLQDAEVAIQDEDIVQAVRLCRDSAVSLIKAIGSFISGYNPEALLEDDRILLKALKDLTNDISNAKSLCDDLVAIKKLDISDESNSLSRQQVEQLLSRTGSVFTRIHTSCFH